jgi:hypothetical protein
MPKTKRCKKLKRRYFKGGKKRRRIDVLFLPGNVVLVMAKLAGVVVGSGQPFL